MEQSECSKLISKNTWSTVPPQAAKLESKNKNGHGNLGVSVILSNWMTWNTNFWRIKTDSKWIWQIAFSTMYKNVSE